MAQISPGLYGLEMAPQRSFKSVVLSRRAQEVKEQQEGAAGGSRERSLNLNVQEI